MDTDKVRSLRNLIAVSAAALVTMALLLPGPAYAGPSGCPPWECAMPVNCQVCCGTGGALIRARICIESMPNHNGCPCFKWDNSCPPS